MPRSQKTSLQKPCLHPCLCGCKRKLTRWTIRRHLKAHSSRDTTEPESLPPPKRRRVALFQTGEGSLPSFDPPPALNLHQSPGVECTQPSGHIVDDILLNLCARTHPTTNQSDSEDSEDDLEGDGVEATDSIDPETDDFCDGEDIDTEGDANLREGIVSDWDLLAEEFIAEAEELGEFEHSFLHTP